MKIDNNESNYVFCFKSQMKGDQVGFTHLIGNVEANSMDILLEKGGENISNQSIPEVARTGAHEFGHSVGLRHPNDKNNTLIVNNSNLMSQTVLSSSVKVTKAQLEEIARNVK